MQLEFHHGLLANRADIRVFADPIGRNTQRLDQHDSRITKLERRSK
jgi:hypothetical protein